jgi:hypothetical protein
MTPAGDAVKRALSKEAIDYINENENAEPKLSIFFPESDDFGIPKVLRIETISLDAKISVDILENEED